LISSKLLRSCYSESKLKACFYRSFNSVFGKIGRIAPGNVIVHLIKTKCLPALLYGVEACQVNKSQMQCFEFVLFSIFMKIFATRSKDVIDECILMFDLVISKIVSKRKSKFLMSYSVTDNALCSLFSANAVLELAELKSQSGCLV